MPGEELLRFGAGVVGVIKNQDQFVSRVWEGDEGEGESVEHLDIGGVAVVCGDNVVETFRVGG